MPIEPSGYYYPNKIIGIYVGSVEKTVGHEAMRKIFKVAGIPDTNYPTPNNFAKEFDFAYFGALNGAIEQLYGVRGGRGLMLHAGRASFSKGWAELIAPVMGIGELAFKAISPEAKLRIGFKALIETFSKFTDQHSSLEDAGDHFIYAIHQCPVCWGRSTDHLACVTITGILTEMSIWLSGGKQFRIEEVTCIAMGDEACRFHIYKTPMHSS